MVFGQNLKLSNPAEKDTNGKGIARGAECLNSISVAPSSDRWSAEINHIKTMDYTHGFRSESENFDSSQNG